MQKIQDMWVRSLGWEDPLAEGMAIYSSILAWRIPMDRGARRVTVHGVTNSWTRLSAHTHTPKNELECRHFFSDSALLHNALSLIGKNGDNLPLCLAQRNEKTWEDEDQLTDLL